MERGKLTQRKPCPKENASFFSLLTFSYILNFIYKGTKEEIEEHDLFNVMNTLQAKKLGDRLERHWHRQKAKNINPSITKSLIDCYGRTLLLMGIAQIFVKLIALVSTPWALGKFISYFQTNQTEMTKSMALYYGGIMVTISFLNGLWNQHFTLWKLELGLKLQGSVTSLLYRKALSLSHRKLSEVSVGKIVTSIVKDTPSLNHAILYGIDFFLETFQVLVVCYMLYAKVGSGAISGLSIMGLSLIFQLAVSRIIFQRRDNCNSKSDQRLQQTQEVLSSIRLIKMYHWESFFGDKLIKLRKIEMKNLQMIFIWKSISILLGIISGRIAQASVFTLQIFLGMPLSADTIYYVHELFQKVSKSMIFIPLGIQFLAEVMVSLKRINVILNAEENDTMYKSTINMMKPEILLQEIDVEFRNQTILNDINLQLKPGLHILIGPSGCGKSTLLKTLLEEYNTLRGTLKIQGTISYASQSPWLFPSSVKQNILFGQQFEEEKYKRLLNICGLTYDLNNFENGDETILTDCGANLSRGQQSRINLARALYRDSDIYLLDDCLASLDINIKKHVFNNAIKNYLNGKLCILVTHSTQFVNQANNVIIMADNTVKYSGEPDKIPKELFIQIEQDQNDDVDETIDEQNNNEMKESKETDQLLSKVKIIEKGSIYTEKKKKGKINYNCYKKYFSFGGGLIMVLSLIGLHILCEVTSGIGEKFMSTWVNMQRTNSTNVTTSSDFSKVTTPSYILQENYSATVDEEEFIPNSTSSTILTTVLNNTMFRDLLLHDKGIKNIHKSMVRNILQGVMSFFDSHLIGNIMTRFSKDLFIMDEMIPFIWLEGIRLFFLLPICLLLIASVSSVLAVASIGMTILFYFLCEFVLSTTRSAQRLSNSTLSPVIGHLNSSLEGLMIIRAYGTKQILKDEFDKHVNLYISANHTREIAARVLGLYSHTMASIFTLSIVLKLILVDKDVLPGNAGLVLSQSNLVCLLLEMGLMMWMVMENSMTSVERALEYTNLPQENQNGREIHQWPSEGRIEYRNVTLTYRTNGETVLKDLNIYIHPQEKIGIVGRTGAGKSSIILTLFKMYDFSGDILIDNVNIKTLTLECLRTNLAIIPQEPVIFSGTVRTNIDPKQMISDEEVWKLLEVINLKSAFNSLDENIAEKNLSVGQKQLICLARALIKKSKIVVLDEATANMDEEMDLFIQNKIRDLFQFCTIIVVAHRLHTVRNCDRIIVMDKGKIVEFDSPRNLLKNTNGMFYKMVHQKKNE
ncbi:hypothetical protein HHI36_005339 [Cryptolaemus montrouzieri]|uniref:Uncharacterized protein n=1 Tax=Cryptolaemus montrouzieri TaxID=559131 RepID=A0ABD2NUG6_9CUCU